MMSKLRNREESLRSSGEREKYQTQQRQCWSLLSGDEIHFFSDSLRRPEWTEYQKWTAKEGKIIVIFCSPLCRHCRSGEKFKMLICFVHSGSKDRVKTILNRATLSINAT